MKGFKNKPAVLPAAEPSAAKFGEDEAAPETRGEANGEAHLEGGASGSGETGIAGHKKKRVGSGLPPWLRIKPQDRWPLVRVVLVVVLCISAGWYFVDFYGGKDAQAGQALPGGGRCGQCKCEPCRGARHGFSDADINAGAFCFGEVDAYGPGGQEAR